MASRRRHPEFLRIRQAVGRLAGVGAGRALDLTSRKDEGQDKMKPYKSLLVILVAIFATGVTIGPASANSQSGTGKALYTNGPCYQHWDASLTGGISFYSTGDGNGQVLWGSRTDVTKTYYDFNHPAVSKNYPTNFATLFYRVREGTTEKQTGPNFYGGASQYHVSGSGGFSYPEEDNTWTQSTSHTWAASERCGRYYTAQTATAVPVPPYQPSIAALGALQPAVYQADVLYSAANSLANSLDSTVGNSGGVILQIDTPTDNSDPVSVINPTS